MPCVFPSDRQHRSNQKNVEFPTGNNRPAAERRIVGLLLAVLLISAGCGGPKESTEGTEEEAAQSEQAT